MKKKLIVYTVLALIIFSIFDFFHVSGREIEHVKDITADCTVTVVEFERTPTTGIGTGGLQETGRHTLAPAQTAALKELLLSSSFRRSLAKTMIWQSEDGEMKYDILIDFNDGQRFISIHATANRFLSISNQFGGNFLIIGKNTEFEKGLIHVYRSTI